MTSSTTSLAASGPEVADVAASARGPYIKVTNEDNTVNDIDAPHNKLLTGVLNAVGVQDPTGGPVTLFGHPDYAEPGEFDVLKV